MSLIIGSNKYKPYVGNKGASVFLGSKKLYPTEDTVNYLTLTATQANSSVTLNANGSLRPTMEYNDGSGWKTYTFRTAISLASVGDKVQFRGDNASLSYSSSETMQFAMTGKIAASGSVMTLFDKKDELRAVNKNMCRNVFRYCNSLVSAPELPATTLAENGYNSMFQGCTSLVTAPELPARTLAESCYQHMFNGCTSLKTAPELLATSLRGHCYLRMFYGCTSLTAAPELPATTLATQCYDNMFYGCTKIKLSETQTGDYQTAYRIPSIGTGKISSGSLTNMFANTGGTFTGTPTINTTYYGAW